MFFSILHKRWRLTLICLCSGIGGGVRFPGCCTWLWNSEKTQGKNFVFQTWFVNERWLFVLLNQKVTIPPLRNVFLFGTILWIFVQDWPLIVQNCDHWGQQWASSSCESLWVQIASSSSFGSTPSGVAAADHLQHLQRPQISLSEIFFVSLMATSCLTSFVLAPLTLATALLASLRSYFSLLPKFKYYYVPDNIDLFIYLSVSTTVWISGTSVLHTIPWLLK